MTSDREVVQLRLLDASMTNEKLNEFKRLLFWPFWHDNAILNKKVRDARAGDTSIISLTRSTRTELAILSGVAL